MQDEFDSESPEIEREAPGVFKVRGHAPIERLNRELELELPAEGADTLSGMLVDHLRRLPAVGDTVDLTGVTATVLSVERGRATVVHLATLEGKAPDQA